MPLVNWKVELKLQQKKVCILFVNGYDNEDANSNNIIFTIEDAKLCVPVVTLLAKDDKNYQKLLAKDLKDECMRTNIKQKAIMKIQQTSIDNSLNQTCFFWFIQIKITKLNYLKLKDITYQRHR